MPPHLNPLPRSWARPKDLPSRREEARRAGEGDVKVS